MVDDGDNRNLPFYVSNFRFNSVFTCSFYQISHLIFHFNLQRAKTPELVPESAEPMRSGVPKTVKATQKLLSLWNRIKDYLADPRMGPTLLLGALLSAGNVWWMRSRSSTQQPAQTNQPSPNQPADNVEEKKKKERKREQRRRNAKEEEVPASITDNEPKDAVQILSSGSDSD
jgi:hypothetical protein